MARIGKVRRRRRGRGWLAVVVGLVLLVAAASVAVHRLKLAGSRPSEAPAVSGVPFDDAPGVRIMPLGDSLTDGQDIPGGYRIDLWARFAADGEPINFVGSQANGPPSL